MKKLKRRALLALVLQTGALLSGKLYAGANEGLTRPFAVTNDNPFVQIFGQPTQTSARLIAPGATLWTSSYSVASHFEIGQHPGEQILIDGETERVLFGAARGLDSGWELGFEVPMVRHSGGYLDDLIIDWHDWFDLPQNGRDRSVQDRLGLIYSGQDEQISVVDAASGIGDIRLYASRSLRASPTSATSWRALIKLPTGDSDELLGSGGVDVAVSVQHEQRLGAKLLWGATAGAAYHSSGDVLPSLVRPVVAHAGARVAYEVSPRVALKIEWDVHSQVYERSRVRQLNEIAYLLSFGGSIRIGERGVLDLVVVENYPHPEITPDVAFQIAFSWFAAAD